MAIIGVDIGHGSNTFPPSKGVYKNGKAYHEHDANSRVAKRLTSKLKAAGHKVVQAQGAGKLDVHLTNRTNLYFANNVDLIVSCHANAGASSADGYASFYWHNDSTAKKLSDLYVEEIKTQGFALWGGSRPSKPNDWSNFHMCRVPSNKGVPSILLENGFMTNAKDFEWIFGGKKNEYAERCATAAFNAIQRFLGESPSKKVTAPKTEVKSKNTSSKPAGKSSSNLLRKGDKGAKVTTLQKDLLAIGEKLPKYGADGDFGAETENAVKSVQRKAKIVVDGIVGPDTRKAIADRKQAKQKAKAKPSAKLPNSVYRANKPYPKGSGVKAVQQALASVYFYPDKGAKNNGIDSVYGPKTADAVRRFQSVHGLVADGVYGPKTRAKLSQVAK